MSQNSTGYSPPTDARYDPQHLPWQVDLMWTPPQGWIHSAVDRWYEWDKGINTGGVGTTFIPGEAAARWDAAQISMYNTVYLTKIKYYLIQPLVQYTLRIYQGTPESFDTLLNLPLISNLVYNTFDTIDLEPIQIDVTKDMWLGYHVNNMAPSMPLPTGCIPEIDGYGNMVKISENGFWTTLLYYNPDIRYNWNIGGYLETPNDTIIYPLFNIYRAIDDGEFEKQTEEPFLDTIYYDDVNNITASHIYYYVTCIYEDGESEPSNIVDVSFVSSRELDKKSITIYPNPASDHVYIESEKGIIGSLQLIDGQGRVVIERAVDDNQIVLDVLNLTSSFYFLRVVGEDGVLMKKLVILK